MLYYRHQGPAVGRTARRLAYRLGCAPCTATRHFTASSSAGCGSPGRCTGWSRRSAPRPTARRESLASRLLHVVPLVVGGVLIGWRAMPWAALMPAPVATLAARSTGIGVRCWSPGLAFAVWARVHLGRNWSGSVTVKEGHELIRTGPYAYVRHPIYTGLITAVLGTAIASGTVRALLGLVIIVVSLRAQAAYRGSVSCARPSRASTSATARQVPALSTVHKSLRNLHRVERGALEQLIPRHEQRRSSGRSDRSGPGECGRPGSRPARRHPAASGK